MIEKDKETGVFYKNLLDRALGEIDSLAAEGQAIVMVCGPLRGKDGTDTLGNMARIREMITKVGETEAVFDQTKYQDTELEDAPHEFEMKMELFYKKLIVSGKIAKLYILPGWQESEGTKAEMGYAEEAGIPVEHLG